MEKRGFLESFISIMGLDSWEYVIASIIIGLCCLAVLGIGELVDSFILPIY